MSAAPPVPRPRSNRSTVPPFFRFLTFSIVSLNFNLVALLLDNKIEQPPGSLITTSNRIVLSTLRWNSSGSNPAAMAFTSILPCFGLYRRPSGSIISVSPDVSKVFPRGTVLNEHPAIYRHARIRLQHTEYLAAIILTTRLLRIYTSTRSPCISTSSEISTSGKTSRARQPSSFGSPKPPALTSSRALSIPHHCLVYARAARNPSRQQEFRAYLR